MARKRYSDEECLRVLWQIQVELASGADVATAFRAVGIRDYALSLRNPLQRFIMAIAGIMLILPGVLYPAIGAGLVLAALAMGYFRTKALPS